jgi:hypothetical protein
MSVNGGAKGGKTAEVDFLPLDGMWNVELAGVGRLQILLALRCW